jgi:hypothetical protein
MRGCFFALPVLFSNDDCGLSFGTVHSLTMRIAYELRTIFLNEPLYLLPLEFGGVRGGA